MAVRHVEVRRRDGAAAAVAAEDMAAKSAIRVKTVKNSIAEQPDQRRV